MAGRFALNAREEEGCKRQELNIEITIDIDDECKVSANVLPNYVLRAISGVTGANKAMIKKYKCIRINVGANEVEETSNENHKNHNR